MSSLFDALSNLISSILSIFEGILNAIFAVFQSVFAVITTALSQTAGLAESIVAFLLNNIVILSFIGVSFVGYSVYTSRNNAVRSSGLKKKL